MEKESIKFPDEAMQFGEIVFLARPVEKGFETQYFVDKAFDFRNLVVATAVIEATLACEAAQRKGNQENPLPVSEIIDIIAALAKDAAEALQESEQQTEEQSADNKKESELNGR